MTKLVNNVLMGFNINIPAEYKDEEDEFVPKIILAIRKNATGFWDSRLKREIRLNEIFTGGWDFTTTAAEMDEREHWTR